MAINEAMRNDFPESKVVPKSPLITNLREVSQFIKQSEESLIDSILAYAKDREYVKYTSTLREAWKISINGLSQAICDAINTSPNDLELHPDEDYTDDLLAKFAILEARRHRNRGVNLSMFLGLFKYYRQSYRDLFYQGLLDNDLMRSVEYILNRVFDRIEIAFTAEWVQLSGDTHKTQLEATNRRITNEKNEYLTVIESLASPVILLDKSSQVVFLNNSATLIFGLSKTPGSFYYRESPITVALPSELEKHIQRFYTQKHSETIFEFTITVNKQDRCFQVRVKRMLDISEKFSGAVLLFHEITSRKQAEKRLKEREEKYRLISQYTSDFVYTALITREKVIWIDWVAGAYESITGYTSKEIRNLKGGCLSLAHPVDRERIDPNQFLLNKSKPFTIEYRIHNKGGELRWLRDCIKPLWDDKACRISGLLGAVQDITEHKKAEAEIKQLKGIIPICASCKKIRNDAGYWELVEVFIQNHSQAEFSHGICPDCTKKLYTNY